MGKTILARALAPNPESLVQTDECLPNEPSLNPISGVETWSQRPTVVRDLLIHAAEVAIPHLRAVADARSKELGSWVMEGERIHPRLVRDLERAGSARGVFIVESSTSTIAETLLARVTIDPDLATVVAEVNRLYGMWLIAHAEKFHLRCVSSRPWQTLRDRTLDAVALPYNPRVQRTQIAQARSGAF